MSDNGKAASGTTAGNRQILQPAIQQQGTGPLPDTPLAHQGSGGPGDDRQDNSAASSGPINSQRNGNSSSRKDRNGSRPSNKPDQEFPGEGTEMSPSDPE